MSKPNSTVWIVGSQQGFRACLDDCIIHGVYHDKPSGIKRIFDLQAEAPEDTFGLIPVPMNRDVDMGFNLNEDWMWYAPGCEARADPSYWSDERSINHSCASRSSFDILRSPVRVE